MRTVAVILAIAVTTTLARASEWVAAPPNGRIVVHAYKKGLLSAFAHDHHFEASRWRVTASVPDGDPASTQVVLVVEADSLRDRQPRLSQDALRKVNAQAAGPDVLDAHRHPRIEFRSLRLEVDPGAGPERVTGTLHGTLTLRGRSVPTAVTIDAERTAKEWRIRGKARLKQTDFGIEPFSGFAGTVAVKNDVDVEIALILRPAD